jgi:hypothetical protein
MALKKPKNRSEALTMCRGLCNDSHRRATLPEAYICTQLPGLEAGQWHEVKVKADSKNVLEESNENNNTAQARIER